MPAYKINKLDAAAVTPKVIDAALYKRNIIKFFEEQYYEQGSDEPIILEAWQKRILKAVFGRKLRRHSDLRQFKMALIMIPKKNGKSTLASGVALWSLLFDDDFPEVYTCANDLEQSRIIFRMVTGAIGRNKSLYELVTIKNDLVERKDGRGFLRAMAADAASAHGLNPSMVIFDELWGQQSEDLFSAMSLSPTRPNSMQFIISYAGYDKTSLLYRLFEKGIKGEEARMYFFHSTRNLASWVTKEYLNQQKSFLHPGEFSRMHECRWTDAENAFLDSTEIDKCVDEKLLPSNKGTRSFVYFCGLDVGLKNDKTVAVVSHYDYHLDSVVLDEIVNWQGTSENPVSIESIKDYLIDAHQRFHFNKIIADPWQSMQLIENLKSKKLPIEEYTFSAQNINRLTSNLFSLFHNRRIKIFYYKYLIDELKTVQAVATSYGYRIDHKSGKHDDHVVSLGLSALLAVQHQRPAAAPEIFSISLDGDKSRGHSDDDWYNDD